MPTFAAFKDGKVVGKGDLIVKYVFLRFPSVRDLIADMLACRWDFIFTEAEKGMRLRWHDLKKVMHWKL